MDRIIRTCSLAGAALLLSPAPASASLGDEAVLAAYAKARVAEDFGAAGQAAQGYALALAQSPNDTLLAARTFSQAMAAGDRRLALQAATVLDRAGTITPDVRLLLIAEAVRTNRHKAAAPHIDALAANEAFAFMAPILRAWIAFGADHSKALQVLGSTHSDPLSQAYAAEHRPLLLLATGKYEPGVEALLELTSEAGARGHRLRIAGAALLARKGKRDLAARLLEGEAPPLVAARELLADRCPIPGEIASTAAGIGEFLVRVAVDLSRQDVQELALVYARLATLLAPENSETWLVTSELLAARDQHREALTVLSQIPQGDPFAAGVLDSRVRLLVASGDREEALAQARAATARPEAGLTDWTRLGDLQRELERPDEAASAYAEALKLSDTAPPGQPLWALHLLRGSALHEAGQWPEAREALEAAYKLAPEQPLVLNYLGYAQLERRENLVEAERLIREASRLEPDNHSITDSLGWAYFIRGDVPKAIELLEKAASGEPADPAINEHLGDAYFSAGRRYEARYAWGAALLYAEEKDAARLRAKIEAGLTRKLAAP